MTAPQPKPDPSDRKSRFARADAVAVYVLAVIFIAWVAAIAIRNHAAKDDIHVIAAEQDAEPYRIDPNRAPAAELMLLPGIGKVRARRIVAWREANGPFTRLDQIRQAAALRARDMENIRNLITLDASPAQEEK